jgi:hypothetical protein
VRHSVERLQYGFGAGDAGGESFLRLLEVVEMEHLSLLVTYRKV